MRAVKTDIVAYAATSCFVCLWGSAAIFTRLGLDNASYLALLIFRFTLALAALLLVGWYRKKLLPAVGSFKQVALTGLLLIGGYSVCYFQAMAHGVTPGLIATIMGIQPILTLFLVERRMQGRRLAGLCIALAGLVLLVGRSLLSSHQSASGGLFALAALLCMTFGAIMQKGIKQPPTDVLPVQFAVSLLFCLALLPVSPFTFQLNSELLLSVLFLGLLISVIAQLLLYRLLNSGSLVNVTSLFYLVPVITALLDYLVLGNTLSWAGMVGMGAILAGIMLVFR